MAGTTIDALAARGCVTVNTGVDMLAVEEQPPRLKCVGVGIDYRICDKYCVTALSNVSFEVRRGEFLSIVGPSGCGKTTLLNVIAGLVMPTKGEAYCDGVLIKGPSPQRTVIFQEYGLFPWKTVGENIAFGLKAKGMPAPERAEMVADLVGLMGLKGFEDRYPSELSGGMRQRVGIARALAPDPEIVLMDEPFGALDSITRKTMQVEMLRIVRSTDKTFVLITHDIEEAIFLADVVMVMTARPGAIKSLVRTDLPRARTHEMRSSDKRFLEMESDLSALLMQEIRPVDC